MWGSGSGVWDNGSEENFCFLFLMIILYWYPFLTKGPTKEKPNSEGRWREEKNERNTVEANGPWEPVERDKIPMGQHDTKW